MLLHRGVFLIFLLVLMVLPGCKQVYPISKPRTLSATSIPFPGYERLTKEDRVRADSLLAYALDHEALYSLMADIKPMSSIGMALSYPIGKDSTQRDGDQEVVPVKVDSIQADLRELESWNRVLKALSFNDYHFLLVPFRKVWEEDRNLQILVCRTDLLDSLLVAQAPFFAQWGFVPGTDPAVVVTATEFEERNDRYRAYGYLFGYPKHAVDFFVAASQEQEQTGELVPRSFFHMPVHAREEGYFTYALPDDFQPLPSDSARYYRSIRVLETYRSMRPSFTNPQDQLEAVKLYRTWWNRERS